MFHNETNVGLYFLNNSFTPYFCFRMCDRYGHFFLIFKGYTGSFHRNVNPDCRLEIVYDSLLSFLSILLLAAIGAKLITAYSGLQVD